MNSKIKRRLMSAANAAILFIAVWGVVPEPAKADSLESEIVVLLSDEDSATQVVKLEMPITEQLVYYPTDKGSKFLSSGFGYRSTSCTACSTNHQGADFTPGYGKKVYAISYGKVVKVGWDSGYGFSIEIQHDSSIGLGGVTTLYAHLIENSNSVKVGDEVIPGQKIGRVGQTGVTTGPHLHFEVRVDGNAVNPIPWLKERRAKSK